jgi:L-lactate oxidase
MQMRKNASNSGNATNASGRSSLPDIGQASDANKAITVINLDMLEQQARRILSPQRMSYAGYEGAGYTYRENMRAFNDYEILPKRMRGVGKDSIDTSTQLLGVDLALPVITCPVGNQGFFHADADLPSAIGTHQSATLFAASGASTKSLEEIAAASNGPKFWQLYMNKDMGLNRELVQRAKKAGYMAIIVTVDSAGPGASDEYQSYGLPSPSTYYPNGNYDPAKGGRGVLSNQKAITFSDIEFLRRAAGLPVIVKGLLRKDDMRSAIKHGASALWISNHGGRQVDNVPASVSRLPVAVDVADGRVPVVLDSGIRWGNDVFRALALGATAVAIGRPPVWGAIVGGAPGVKAVYDYFGADLRNTMFECGVATIAKITRKLLIEAK